MPVARVLYGVLFPVRVLLMSGTELFWRPAYVMPDHVAGTLYIDEQIEGIISENILDDLIPRSDSQSPSRLVVEDGEPRSAAATGLSLDNVVLNIGNYGTGNDDSEHTVWRAGWIRCADMIVMNLGVVDERINKAPMQQLPTWFFTTSAKCKRSDLTDLLDVSAPVRALNEPHTLLTPSAITITP